MIDTGQGTRQGVDSALNAHAVPVRTRPYAALTVVGVMCPLMHRKRRFREVQPHGHRIVEARDPLKRRFDADTAHFVPTHGRPPADGRPPTDILRSSIRFSGQRYGAGCNTHQITIPTAPGRALHWFAAHVPIEFQDPFLLTALQTGH